MVASQAAIARCGADRGLLLLAVGWILLGLAILTVATRIFFRTHIRNGINWDDHFVVASLAIGIAGGAFLTKLVQVGGGKHVFCLPPGGIYPVLKWALLAQVCNVLGIGFVKISVCLCVLRLIDRARRRLSQFLWVLIAFVAMSHLVQALMFLVRCRPLNLMWNPKVKGTCFSARVTYTAGYANYGLDALTDLICAIIPLSVVHRLQMNVRTKIALSILMSLGVLTAGFAIAKCVILEDLFHNDFAWAITNPGILTIAEHYLGIILASMPALKPLFSKVLDATGSSPSGSKRNFQKIQCRTAGLRGGPESYVRSGRSPIRKDNIIQKTTDFRMSSQHELAVSRDCELANEVLPDYLRYSGNSWTHGPAPQKEHGFNVIPGGYRHVDDAHHPTSVPLVPVDAQSA